MKLLPLCATLLLAGTALCFTAAEASAQRGQTGQYCLTGPTGARNCGFQTLAQCNKARLGVTRDSCRRNPRAATQPRTR